MPRQPVARSPQMPPMSDLLGAGSTAPTLAGALDPDGDLEEQAKAIEAADDAKVSEPAPPPPLPPVDPAPAPAPLITTTLPAPALPPSPNPSFSTEEIEREMKEAPQAGGVYRESPESFFGPVMAALIAKGVPEESLKTRAMLVWEQALESCDAVRSGIFDRRWVVKKRLKKAEEDFNNLDREATEKKREHDTYLARAMTLDKRDPMLVGLARDIERLKSEYQKAYTDSIRLVRIEIPALKRLLAQA